MSMSESRSGIVLELAEEFLDCYRKGQRPPLKDYIDRHPELADEILEVFPAMAMMENIAIADDSLDREATGDHHRTPSVPLQQLGDFRIIREIGHGGMGVVYEAEQISLGRHVALKVLRIQKVRDAEQKRRFEREAKAAAKLHHTNIVPVFGFGEYESTAYYVMQYIHGLGLDAVLDELRKTRAGGGGPVSSTLTAGPVKVSREDVSAADMARSLLTGRFEVGGRDDSDLRSDPNSSASVRFGPPNGTSGLPSFAPDSGRTTARQSDSFSLSSSSVSILTQAAAAYAEAVEQNPESTYLIYLYFLSLLASGDQKGYRRVAEDALARYGTATDSNLAHDLARCASLAPDILADHEAFLRLAEAAFRGAAPTRKSPTSRTLGAVLYRVGRFDEAIQRLDEGMKLGGGQGTPQYWAFLALAHHRLGHRAEARRWLDELRAWPMRHRHGFTWEGVEIGVLSREAESVILDGDPVIS